MKTTNGNANLNGKRVAVVVADGFEQEEMTSPMEALADAGAEAVVVSPQDGKVGVETHRLGEKIYRGSSAGRGEGGGL